MTRLRVADDPRPAHVYYCYAADGALLYVGCAQDVNGRVYMHLGYYGSEWMPRYCTRVVAHPSHADARGAAVGAYRDRPTAPGVQQAPQPHAAFLGACRTS